MTENIDPTRGFKPAQPLQQEEQVQRQQREQAKPAAEDRVSLNRSEPVEATYGPGLKVATPDQLLRNLVIKTLQDQGLSLEFEADGTTYDFQTITPEEAQQLISEDGYFGVEKTSQRIVDFAINAFGNDPSKLDEMIRAIDKGFMDAQEAFGGALPEISQQTYEAIMEKLADFAGQSEESAE